MEPVGVSRKLALMPAGHVNVGAGTLRAVGAVRPAISIQENLETHQAEVGDGCGDKCGKTHIFLAWPRAGYWRNEIYR